MPSLLLLCVTLQITRQQQHRYIYIPEPVLVSANLDWNLTGTEKKWIGTSRRVCMRCAHAFLDVQSVCLVLGKRFLFLHPASSCEPCGCVLTTISGGQTCAPSLRAHTHTQTQSGRPEREPKKVCLAKFHAISASKVILLSPRCWTRDGCCSHPFRIMPSSLSLISKSFVLYSKSPASLLLPPSSCPFLFIAFLPISTYYVHVVCMPLLYLSYPLQAPLSCSAYLTVRWLHQCISEDCTLLHFTVCHFVTSPLLQKSITHQIKR